MGRDGITLITGIWNIAFSHTRPEPCHSTILHEVPENSNAQPPQLPLAPSTGPWHEAWISLRICSWRCPAYGWAVEPDNNSIMFYLTLGQLEQFTRGAENQTHVNRNTSTWDYKWPQAWTHSDRNQLQGVMCEILMPTKRRAGTSNAISQGEMLQCALA